MSFAFMSVGVDKVVKDAEFAELLDESVGDERGRLGSFVGVTNSKLFNE